jgi:acetoin:2,6-dichlorophenolindophenol oxidoreductase subunit beta
MRREITYAQAVLEATDQCMSENESVYIMGLGVPDPKGIFGTTLGLREKYGNQRVLDMPVSENAMTGVAIGSALKGMRPILTHQRVDFMLLSLDQVINNAAKWNFMFDGKLSVPMVIRVMIGRGWGQGPQHSQSLHALFAHIPGLKVVMPFSPHDAKGLLISAIQDNNPVIFMEHRWLHNTYGEVPENHYALPLGKAKIVRKGKDLTIISVSHGTLESLQAAETLSKCQIEAEVLDLRSIKPLDVDAIVESVKKTGRVIVVDPGWSSYGLASEIISLITENAYSALKSPPVRIAYPDAPIPTSWSLARHYYPRPIDTVNAARKLLKLKEVTESEMGIDQDIPLDIPDKSFTGPF